LNDEDDFSNYQMSAGIGLCAAQPALDWRKECVHLHCTTRQLSLFTGVMYRVLKPNRQTNTQTDRTAGRNRRMTDHAAAASPHHVTSRDANLSAPARR